MRTSLIRGIGLAGALVGGVVGCSNYTPDAQITNQVKATGLNTDSLGTKINDDCWKYKGNTSYMRNCEEDEWKMTLIRMTEKKKAYELGLADGKQAIRDSLVKTIVANTVQSDSAMTKLVTKLVKAAIDSSAKGKI